MVPIISKSDFVKDVLAKIMSFEGDDLPVSSFPLDGAYPVATTKWEKRNLAAEVPIWDVDACSQCGKCFLICPHAAIRCKVYDKDLLETEMKSFVFNVLGLEIASTNNDSKLKPVMELVLDLRQQARANKDWTTSDKIRDGLAAAGIIVKDGKEGTTWN